jgi:DNA-binding NtrC family response regulator
MTTAELISHFVKDFARRMRKSIRLIPSETMAAFTSYPWPGNVRELQNLIERAVIRSNDDVLPNPLPAGIRSDASIAPEGDNPEPYIGHVKRLHAIPNFAGVRRYRLGDRWTRWRRGSTGIAEN